ncbi:MAG: glycosyltransferase family 4 protein [Planctomyces sp.]|nr:glycosyltransferase family 4 protein [Planctomyces sp.]
MKSLIVPMPRILFLNRSYWPDSEATGQLLTALCEGLAKDFDVHVLAGQPNAAADSEWQDVQVRNGVTIHRVSHTTFSKRRMLLKAVNFLSFVRAAGRQAAQLPKPDVVVFETDPFLLPYVARRLSKTTGCRVIGYLQDIYPDVAVALGKVPNSWPIRRLRQSLFRIYQNCDRMVVLSRDMQQLMEEGGVPSDRIRRIPNWADPNVVYPVETNNVFIDRHGLAGKFVVMYSGNLGLTQRLEEFIEAAVILRDDPRIQFVLIGQGARKADLQAQVASEKLSNVRFLDYQPLSELAHSLSAADLHLVPLTQTLAQCLMPSKLYGILAAGRPYLTNAPEGTELHEITVQEQVGLTCRAGDPRLIADSIRAAIANPSQLALYRENARRLAITQYTQAHAVSAFRQLLTEVTR